MKTIPVQTFYRGMTPDAYEKGAGFVRTLMHFDNYSKENQLIPFHSNENGDSGASTNQIGTYEFANNKLYGLSYASGSSVKLFFNTDFASPSWGTASNMTITAAYQGIMKDYHGALYMSRAAQFDAYTYAAARLDANISSLGVPFTDAVVHSKDDTLYLASNNKIYANSSAVAANPPTAALALTLSADYTIASMCEYGDYLALLLTPVNLGARTLLYLWSRSTTSRDGDTSVAVGNIQGLLMENVAGELVIIGQKSTAEALTYSISFYSYSGGVPELFARFDSSTNPTFAQSGGKQVINNRFYFSMGLTWNGNFISGVWQVSRPRPGQPFEVTLDKIISDSAITVSDVLYGFFQVGDYMFISYESSGNFAMSKTDDQANYTNTSIMESVINPNMSLGDQTNNKKLEAVAAYFVPLTSGQQLVMQCRVDSTSASDWKTLFTKTSTSPDTNLAMYETPIIQSMAVADGVNYEFRLKSTGGAIPVGFAYKYQTLPSNIS